MCAQELCRQLCQQAQETGWKLGPGPGLEQRAGCPGTRRQGRRKQRAAARTGSLPADAILPTLSSQWEALITLTECQVR